MALLSQGGSVARAVTGSARTLREIMTTSIPTVRFDDTLPDIVHALLEGSAHRVIVLDADGKAIGLISDSDVVARIGPAKQRGVLAALLGTAKLPSSEVTAKELMSPGVLTAPPKPR